LQQFPIPGHPWGLTLYDVGMYQEIYPGSKLKHFKVIHQVSKFDDKSSCGWLHPLLLLLAKKHQQQPSPGFDHHA